jgi:hypothetical protein
MINLVEMFAENEGHWNQPCLYGHLVDGHAVYCHNDGWRDGPRKCRNSWYYGKGTGHDDKYCPGFEPNPNYKEG